MVLLLVCHLNILLPGVHSNIHMSMALAKGGVIKVPDLWEKYVQIKGGLTKRFIYKF